MCCPFRLASVLVLLKQGESDENDRSDFGSGPGRCNRGGATERAASAATGCRQARRQRSVAGRYSEVYSGQAERDRYGKLCRLRP